MVYRKNRNLGFSKHLGGYAAQQDGSGLAAATGADNDEVRFLLLCLSNNFVRWLGTLGEHTLDPYPAFFNE